MSWTSEVVADNPWVAWPLTSAPGDGSISKSGSGTKPWFISGSTIQQQTPITGTGYSMRSGGTYAARAEMEAAMQGANGTMSFWVRVPSGNMQGVLAAVGVGDGWHVGVGGTTFDNAGRQIILCAEGLTWNPTGYSLPAGAGTYHIGVKKSGTTWTLLVNGTQVGTGTFSPSTPNTYLSIGGRADGSRPCTTVDIDSFAFYSTALTNTRIAAHNTGGPTEQAADSPFALLSLDDNTSFGYTDLSGNSRPGAVNGTTPTLAAVGPLGGDGVAQFPDASSYISTAETVAQPTTVTYEAWVYPEATPTSNVMISCFGGSGGSGITSGLLIDPAGKALLSIYTGGSVAITSPTALPLNQWSHVVASVGAAGMKLRINKTTVATDSATAAVSAATGSFYVRDGGPNADHGTSLIRITGVAAWRSQLSDTRTDAHYDAAGYVPTITGTLSATLPALTGAFTGTTKVTGALAAVLPVLTASLSGDSGVLPGSSMSDIVISGTSSIEAEFYRYRTLPPTRIDGASAVLASGLKATTSIDPSTGKPPYRLVVVDRGGNAYAELENAVLGDLTFNVQGGNTFSFTLPDTDPKNAECLVVQREVQVWRGTRLLDWYVLVRARMDSSGQIVYQCQSLEWYFTRRVLGRVPKKNLLTNGDFEQGDQGWRYGHLPGGKGKPTRSGSDDRVLNGTRSLMVGNGGTTSQTIAADSLFTSSTSTTLSSSGMAALTSVANATFGDTPWIGIDVYHDNRGDDRVAKALTVQRGLVISQFLATVKPSLRGWPNGFGVKSPRASNATSAGRAKNRRVVFRYRDNAGKKGHKQVVYQRREITNPIANQAPLKVSLTAWVNVAAYQGPAANAWGLMLDRELKSRPAKDRRWARAGYRLLKERSVVPINADTPRNRWVRMEASVTVPADGKTYILDARLLPPDGYAYWDEAWLTTDDALVYSDDEQAKIVRDLVAHSQDVSMGKSDLNIKVRANNTKVRRTRTYTFSDRTYLSDALNDFANLGDGMELSIEVTPESRTLTTHYPRKGSDKAYVLASASNVASFSEDSDGTLMGSTVVVRADGSGSGREEGVAMDAAAFDGLVLEQVYDATPGSAISSLQAQAARGIARYKRPVVVPSVQMNPKFTTELLDTLTHGDRVRVALENSLQFAYGLHRITSFSLDPSTDQITYTLAKEDDAIVEVLPYNSTGWRYFHQAQSPITGANNHAPVQSNVAYGATAYDDSAWSVGQAPIGWFKYGSKQFTDGDTPRNTTITQGHELWMRKTFKATSNVWVSAKIDRFAYIYVNGHLLTGTHISSADKRNRGERGPYLVPQEWLDPSGVQVVAMHVQDDLYTYTRGVLSDILVGDVKVRGTYNENEVV